MITISVQRGASRLSKLRFSNYLDRKHLRDPIKSYHGAFKNVNSNEFLAPLRDTEYPRNGILSINFKCKLCLYKFLFLPIVNKPFTDVRLVRWPLNLVLLQTFLFMHVQIVLFSCQQVCGLIIYISNQEGFTKRF